MSLIAAAAVDGAIGVAHALAFLLAFGALTTLTMTAVAFVWGRTLGTGLARVLKCAGGVLGGAIGTALVVEVLLGVALPP
jgi:hypothetical protein